MTQSQAVVRDELELLSSLVPLEGAEVLELGCGAGAFARSLVERTKVASVTAFEVDVEQHRKNMASPPVPRLRFVAGGAEEIRRDDGSADLVLMMKSLHHVPTADMDRALREIARVLKPGAWLYVSEPVFAGPLNEIIRLFHDEGVVRAQAYQALQRARRDGVLEWVSEHSFDMPARYRDYDDFVAKHVALTHSAISYPPAIAAEVRRRLESHMTEKGASFLRPMRVNVMRRAA